MRFWKGQAAACSRCSSYRCLHASAPSTPAHAGSFDRRTRRVPTFSVILSPTPPVARMVMPRATPHVHERRCALSSAIFFFKTEIKNFDTASTVRVVFFPPHFVLHFFFGGKCSLSVIFRSFFLQRRRVRAKMLRVWKVHHRVSSGHH